MDSPSQREDQGSSVAESGGSPPAAAKSDSPSHPTVCRRCTMCEGQDHHWDYYGDEDEAGEPVMSCKHCDATRSCDGEDI